MDQERHNRVSALFLAVCQFPPAERRDRLREQTAGDEESLAAVEAMLDAEASHPEFLAAPALGDGFTVADRLGATNGEVHEGIPPGRKYGSFTIRRLLGLGGMSEVYEAEQEHPRRRVALKIVRGPAASRSAMHRFRVETEALGRLDHPGVARIYDAGLQQEEGGPPALYFAMELVRGSPITEHAAAGGLGVAERVELLARVCDAVHHAHLHGVIHRDLKPANILVTEGGMPKVLDFGVARATARDVDATTWATEAGQLIGTLPYMSPEQAAGDPRAIDTRSDVYSLGVVLYEVLSGRLPYPVRDAAIPDAFRMIRERSPAPLGAADRALRGDLATITAKALEKEPARRYQSAAELAEDLRRFLREEPIAARPAGTVYQLRKLARRNRPAAAAAAALALTLVVATIGSTALAAWALRQRAGALRAQRESQGVSAMLAQLVAGAEVLQDVKMLDVLGFAEQALARGVTDDPRLEATLREYVGDGFLKASRPDLALPHVDRALEIRRSLPPPDLALIRAMRLAAKARFGERRVDEGRALILEAIELRRRLFGPAHVQTHPDRDLMFFVNYYLPEEPEARLDRARVDAEQRAQTLLARDAISNPRVSPVRGAPVFEDDFDGTEVEPGWTLFLEESTGWSPRFDASRLIVDGIRPRRVSPHANVPNSLVTLQRRFPPLGDFHVRAVVGWDNGGDGSVMHAVHVEVVGQSRIIAAGTYQDAAAFYFGGRPVAQAVHSVAPGQSLPETVSGEELPDAGEAVIELERLGETVTVYWNSTPLLQARSNDPAFSLRLRFGHLAVSTRDYTSRFAPLWIDRVELRGVPLP